MSNLLHNTTKICDFLYSSFGNFYLLKNNDKNINFLYFIVLDRKVFGYSPLVGIVTEPVSKDIDIYLNYECVGLIELMSQNYNEIFLFVSHLKANGFDKNSDIDLRNFVVEKASNMVIFS